MSETADKSSGKLSHWLFVTGGIFLAVAGSFLTGRYAFPIENNPLNIVSDCNKNYPFLRANLDCTTANDDVEHVNKIQDLLSTYIDEQKAAGKITRTSVFFRDLTSRHWAAVDKNEHYAPGSLLKVALAIAYYKLAEIQPQMLDQEFVYKSTQKSINDMEVFKPKDPLVAGKSYTVEQLIEHMIKYSDNDTTVLLNNSIDKNFFSKVLSDLGIHIPESGGSEQNFLGVENYSSILRSLYLSSYLNIDNSQKLLGLMAESSFSEGIASGIPSDVPVAHKFGERMVTDEATSKELTAELHDCGIVYKPTHPYILCVMTEGKSYDDLSKIIAEISKEVYETE